MIERLYGMKPNGMLLDVCASPRKKYKEDTFVQQKLKIITDHLIDYPCFN
jgi:hypothetical protein